MIILLHVCTCTYKTWICATDVYNFLGLHRFFFALPVGKKILCIELFQFHTCASMTKNTVYICSEGCNITETSFSVLQTCSKVLSVNITARVKLYILLGYTYIILILLNNVSIACTSWIICICCAFFLWGHTHFVIMYIHSSSTHAYTCTCIYMFGKVSSRFADPKGTPLIGPTMVPMSVTCRPYVQPQNLH